MTSTAMTRRDAIPFDDSVVIGSFDNATHTIRLTCDANGIIERWTEEEWAEHVAACERNRVMVRNWIRLAAVSVVLWTAIIWVFVPGI